MKTLLNDIKKLFIAKPARKPMAVWKDRAAPIEVLTPAIFTTDRPRSNGERLLDYKWRRFIYEENMGVTHPDECPIGQKEN